MSEPADRALVRYQNFIFDSSRWHGFALRPGDIVISTPPKCGTTWTQMKRELTRAVVGLLPAARKVRSVEVLQILEVDLRGDFVHDVKTVVLAPQDAAEVASRLNHATSDNLRSRVFGEWRIQR